MREMMLNIKLSSDLNAPNLDRDLYLLFPYNLLCVRVKQLLANLSESVQSEDVLHSQDAAQVFLYDRLTVGRLVVLSAGSQSGQHLSVLWAVDVLWEQGHRNVRGSCQLWIKPLGGRSTMMNSKLPCLSHRYQSNQLVSCKLPSLSYNE